MSIGSYFASRLGFPSPELLWNRFNTRYPKSWMKRISIFRTWFTSSETLVSHWEACPSVLTLFQDLASQVLNCCETGSTLGFPSLEWKESHHFQDLVYKFWNTCNPLGGLCIGSYFVSGLGFPSPELLWNRFNTWFPKSWMNRISIFRTWFVYKFWNICNPLGGSWIGSYFVSRLGFPSPELLWNRFNTWFPKSWMKRISIFRTWFTSSETFVTHWEARGSVLTLFQDLASQVLNCYETGSTLGFPSLEWKESPFSGLGLQVLKHL